MGRRQAGDGNAEGRTAHIVETGNVAELDGAWLAAMLATDADLQLGARLSSLADAHLDPLADTIPIQRLEGVAGQDAALDIV